MIEVLQKVDCSIEAPFKIKLKRGQYSVRVLCGVLQVLRGTFYNHIFRDKRANKSYQIGRTQLSEKILQIFNESN